jgi:hypothetical protein
VVVVDLARSLRLDRAHRVPSDRGESRLESVRSASGDGPPGDAICDDTAATASSGLACFYAVASQSPSAWKQAAVVTGEVVRVSLTVTGTEAESAPVSA